jgi:hypothetical protein
MNVSFVQGVKTPYSLLSLTGQVNSYNATGRHLNHPF